jgi:hypothetical protein
MRIDTRTPTADEINAMTPVAFKTYENRLRRAAERQGLKLIKSKSCDPRAPDYGGYMLTDARTNAVIAGELGGPQALSSDEVAQALWGP